MVMRTGTPIALWEGPPPGSESWSHEELVDTSLLSGVEAVRNVTIPTMTPYLPAIPTERAAIVCPGGAMHFLAIEHEGRSVAERLSGAGIAAFVLTYRVVPTPVGSEACAQAIADAFRTGIREVSAPVLSLAVADAERAVELVRAEGFGHVTMIGFSAGAWVTSEAVLHGGGDGRPDAAAVFYLPSVDECSPDGDSPPLFVAAAANDPLGVDGSFSLTAAWRAAGAPVELHVFERGGHGFGTTKTGLPVDVWPELLLAWMESLSLT